jgi:hypothetical protein
MGNLFTELNSEVKINLIKLMPLPVHSDRLPLPQHLSIGRYFVHVDRPLGMKGSVIQNRINVEVRRNIQPSSTETPSGTNATVVTEFVNVDSIFNLIYRSHSIQINYVLMYVH